MKTVRLKKVASSPGDVILAVDGTPIKSPRDLSRLIASKGPDANVSMQLWRNDKSIADRVVLQEMPDSRQFASNAKIEASKTKLGLILKNTDNGVVIASVLPNSPAAEKGLKAGDVIQKIGSKNVKTANDVRQAITHLSNNNHGRVLMLQKTDHGNRFVALKLDKSTG
jgi:serine protease Do